MADLTISSLRGGLNSTDPPSLLQPDQCTLVENVEFVDSTLGERRRGCSAVTLPASITAKTAVTFLHRHTPTNDETETQLWALGATVGASVALAYKDTSWHDVSFVDAATTTSPFPYQFAAQSLHGKLFLAYKSGTNRLHVWDGTSLRRTGLATPAAPSVANTGSGTYAVTRYFRVRYTVQSGGSTIIRSEPSATTSFTPSGSGSAARITKPASISENETHWEVEASLDNANFYRIATVVVGTTTYDDSTVATTGYAVSGVLSEDSGDYTTIHSGKFLSADQDRLLIGGSWEDSTKASRISWTPVLNDPGVGNDERVPIDTDSFLDLDGFEGGELTAMSRAVNGYVFAFKWSHIYKLVRTGLRSRAYEQFAITKKRGALPGSLVEAIDQAGNACLYFLDPHVGPCRLGVNGLQTASWDIQKMWRARINIGAVVVSRGVYYTDTQQVHWCIALDGSNTPSHRLVLQTNHTQLMVDGVRRGWSLHTTGKSCKALAMCEFATNVNSGVARSLTLKPLIGIADTGGGTDHVQMLDSGTDDDGDVYIAKITTAPFAAAGLLNKFGIMAGTLWATAATGVSVKITLTGFSSEDGIVPVSKTVSLTPVDTEAQVVKFIDNLSIASIQTLQITFEDEATPTGRWELHQLALKPDTEETA